MPDCRLVVFMLNKREVAQCSDCRKAYTHATNRTAATTVDSAAVVMRSCSAAPVATTSNGEPPPESEFDNWLVPPLLGALLGSVTSVGAAPVGFSVAVDVAPVAVVSRFSPEDDAREGCVVLVGGAAVVVTGVDVLVLVCKVVCAVDEELELVVVCWLLGHSAAIPRSFWKTPMIDVSPTSTLAHPVLTAAPIFVNPATQAELQVAPRAKSEETQASILVS